MMPKSKLPSLIVLNLIIVTLTFSSLIRTALAGVPRYHPIRRKCGVNSPSDNLRQTHRWLRDHEPQPNQLWNATSIQSRHAYWTVDHSNHDHANNNSNNDNPRKRQSPTPDPIFTIDTYMHIVSDTASAQPTSPNYVSDNTVQEQFTYLANAFANSSIGYRLVSVSRTTNDLWAANGDDLAMKRSLRRGSYAALNIYFQSQLQANDGDGVPGGSTLLGFCTLPAAGISVNTDPDLYVVDGCNILSATMPGGSYGGYNLGGTAVHEVGHWNGLLHTFEGETCSPSHFGDYVADTPQQRVETNNCPPTAPDTCPNSGLPSTLYNGDPNNGGGSGGGNSGGNGGGGASATPYGPQGFSGVDNIHNYMDYSTDICYTGFSPGQAARMINLWGIYREGL